MTQKGRVRLSTTERESSDDLALMFRLQSGDVAAFGDLFERYNRLVFSIVRKIVSDAATAEDITQTVFLKVLRAPGAFRGGTFVSWLRRVSRNCALDEFRHAKPVVEMLPMANTELSAYDRVVADLDARRLHVALDGLNSKQRSVIELNFFESLTHNEIAHVTKIPLGTVKTRIREGMRSLRYVLQDRR